MLTARKDVATGLPDCSLLVSPDGDLLLVPTGAGEIPHDMFRIRKVKQSATMEASAGTQNGESLEENDAAQTQENKKSTGASVSVSPLEVCEDGDDDVGLNDIPQHSSFSELMRQSKDDYASAMFLGNDLQGDKALNRFSAKGWSVPATALALQQTGSSLNALAHFCEQIVLSRKECAARTAIACDNLRSESEARRGFNECNNMTAEQWEILDPRATVFELTAGRIGPLASEGSTLHSAVVAVEQYHNLAAEKESKRWRTASLQRTGVLPAMHAAMDQFQERASKRQQTLEETSRKAMLMEVRMRKLKQLSAKRWEAVYKAEDRVTKRLEELMAERSRERQKARFDKILEQQQQQLDQVTSEELTLANNLSEEVWDMVSSVAESMENGSFEPMMADTANAISDEGSTTSLVNLDKEESVPVVLPMACREEIENEVSLPELRAAAMKADDEIQDASDRLLNVLTTLDTTRRSARVAAETCLVSAANAQATCLRSMLELERESLQERLRDLEGLEEVVDKIDVRADIDAYITNDKKERGGLSHLGDDDDGGIASALAILSCHVDGGIGQESSYSSNQARSCNTLTEHSDNDRMASADMLNSAIENLFGENACLAPKTDEDEATVKSRSEFEQNTNFLCQSASGDSASAKARRSTLCYSLNFKRGPNARIATPIQFDAISRVFAAILTGCIDDENGVSNAKMCMMLAQTFFIESPGDVDSDVNLQLVASTQSAQQTRSRRVYVKNKLTNHPIWSRDDFW